MALRYFQPRRSPAANKSRLGLRTTRSSTTLDMYIFLFLSFFFFFFFFFQRRRERRYFRLVSIRSQDWDVKNNRRANVNSSCQIFQNLNPDVFQSQLFPYFFNLLSFKFLPSPEFDFLSKERIGKGSVCFAFVLFSISFDLSSTKGNAQKKRITATAARRVCPVWKVQRPFQ